MQRNSIIMAKHYQVRRRWNNIWKKATIALASVVVFATTYALILPAITMEPEYICGKEAHLHSDACYQLPEVSTASSLICTSNTLGIHEHTMECCDENGELKCGIANFVLHTHNADCFDANGVLLCTLPEFKTHVHDETCFQQPHIHEAACYIQQRGDLVCAIQEGSEHTHLDTCYTQQENLICTLPETEPHTHTTEACYAETTTLLCAEPEVAPHTHSDSCYTEETTKTCSLEEVEGHLHTAACFAEDGTTKICALPEVVGHVHTDACFQTTSVFTCTLSETAGHLHGDACYSEPVYTLTCTATETDGHAHSETCFETVSVVTCAIEENIPHAHTDACFVCTPVLQCKELTAADGVVPVLICEEEELIPHTHEAACFDESGACICGLLQISEHIHGDTCFVITQEQAAEPVLTCGYEVHEHGEACIAKAEADNTLTLDKLAAEGYYCGTVEHTHTAENGCFAEDGSLLCTMTEHTHIWQCQLNLPAQNTSAIETADDWAADLPALTGEIAADLIAVAESQLGYQQSAVNYIIGDEEVLYYSRYADWWGSDPYGDWNAKFIAFCLDHAGITDVPMKAETAGWPEMLADYDQWYDNDGTFAPIPADLAFFDTDEDGTADHVAIITVVNETEGTFEAILERRGIVQKVTYDLSDSEILGYARIPGNEPLVSLLGMPDAQVQLVMDQIDAMPSADEIDAILMAYEDAGDLSGQDEYFIEVSDQVCSVYAQYSSLSTEQKAMVTNLDKLLELEYIWGNQEVSSTYASSISRYNLDANNIFAFDAILGKEAGYKADGVNYGTQSAQTKTILANANVIFVDLPTFNNSTNRINIGRYLLGIKYETLITEHKNQEPFGINFMDWYFLRFERFPDTPEYPGYTLEQSGTGDDGLIYFSNTTPDGFIVMIRKSYVQETGMYLPTGGTKVALAHLNQTPLYYITGETSFKSNSGSHPAGGWNSGSSHGPFGYLTLTPTNIYDSDGKRVGSAAARYDDMKVVDDITFKMFDYSWYINKKRVTDADSTVKNEIHESYRDLAKYFYFRGGYDDASRDYGLDVSMYTPNVNNAAQDGAGVSPYDYDGFKWDHATVEPLLYNGFPVLDFSKDAMGAATNVPSGFTSDDSRSLAYLFDEATADSLDDVAPGAVTQYDANNTLLQFDEDTHTYWYDSAQNAVDYDTEENMFRVRPYTERNSISADWMHGDSADYDDFLPFNYSDGIVNATYYNNTSAEKLRDSSFRMNDVNYWFGMSMEFDFIQGENGTVTYTNNNGETKTDVMKFEFSGDDDVWVFVDGVRILDLGGTHGAVTGLIDFSTGEVKQYLSWDGKGENDTATSFPTTLKDCFELADETPNGGWDTDNSGRFADYSPHTLKFFYMERGTAVANCSIRFNLPNFQNPLVVGKTLEAANPNVNADALEYLQENTEYSYRVVKADANGKPTSALLIQPGQPYTVLDNGLNIGTFRVGADGFFKLKHGQQAIFENIWEIAKEKPVDFVVEEMLPETQTGHYNSVSYTLSAEEGTITDKTDNSVERFVGYYSPTLTSTKSTQIQFRNVVKTDTLSVLKVTKAVTEGSDLAEDQAYTIHVKLDGEYIAEGTKYSIDGTEYAVGENGSIILTGGQTAEFLIPVLAGTTYEVMEDAESGWVVTYTSVTTDATGVETTTGVGAGTFPMNGSVHVTITNSTYVCRVPLRFNKQAVGNSGEADFTFQITQVDENGEEVDENVGVWTAQPTIHVVGEAQTGTTVYFVYGSTVANGTYYYKLTETPTDGWSCDDSVYIVAITVEDGAARITSVEKDGVDYGMDTAPQFNNYKGTSITVDKTVTGNRDEANLSKEFSFTAVVTLNGQPVIPATGEGYTVENDGTVSFTLTDGGAVTITGIPFGAKVTVTEADAPGFSTYYKLNDGSQNYEGTAAIVTINEHAYAIHFYNSGGYALPETGGPGTSLFAGAILMLFSLLCIVCQKRYKGKRMSRS